MNQTVREYGTREFRKLVGRRPVDQVLRDRLLVSRDFIETLRTAKSREEDQLLVRLYQIEDL